MANAHDGYTDSSDDDLLVRRGDVPAEWYAAEAHLGYDAQGRRVAKGEKGSELDRLIAAEGNPDFWRTIYDELRNESVTLNDAQLELLRRIRDRAYVNDDIRNGDYSTEVEVSVRPMSFVPLSKRRFTPSKHERLRINRIIHAFKMGWLRAAEPAAEVPPEERFMAQVGDLWSGPQPDVAPGLVAPRLALPGHASSYNPAPEFFARPPPPKTNLRDLQFSPTAFQDQFERLMSLYLAPRQARRRITMRSGELLPALPDLEDMRPFPTKCIAQGTFRGNALKAIDASADGNFLIVVDEFNNVALIHTITLRLIATLNIASYNVISAQFTARRGALLCSEEFVDFFALKTQRDRFDAAIEAFAATRAAAPIADAQLEVSFPANGGVCVAHVCRLAFKEMKVKCVTLHPKEDFVAFLCVRAGGGEFIKVLSLSRLATTAISLKTKTQIERIAFSSLPTQMLVLTRAYVYVYDLKRQERVKRLVTGSQTLSCLAVHDSGTHVLVGAGDQHLYWHDLEWKELPLRKMKLHSAGLTACRFAPGGRLFASAARDGALVVQYAKVDAVGFAAPTICPLKTLRGHKVAQSFGVSDFGFVGPTHWIASVGCDGKLIIWG